jgi:hypothetical protein
MGLLDGLINVVVGKTRTKPGGTALTSTYNSQNPAQVLTLPVYREHLTDLFSSRQSEDSRTLLRELFRHDPDVSAAVHGYLTLSNTSLIVFAETVDGDVDEDASRKLHQLMLRLTRQVDYSQGFTLKQSIEQLCADLRYMLLLRGGVATELVVDKKQVPDSLRLVDTQSLRWSEKTPGTYKPEQVISGQTDGRSLDAPSFFISFYRRDPTSIYTYSPFVSAINSIASRQLVINDLYRIMNLTGFPRIEITVLEEVLIERAPADIKADRTKLRDYLTAEINTIAQQFNNIRVDQAITHTDSIQVKILNEKNPAVGLNIDSIVQTLNSLNQAALKTMSTLLGRGSEGVNTGSVEARIAAMFADELNIPVADLLQKIFSYCLHQDGFKGFANVSFSKAELRPLTELEPQLSLRAARLRQDLSDGIISDVEYHLQMYGRLPPPSAPRLSGTEFMSKADTSSAVNPADVSPNTDPLGRSISPDGKSKQINSPPKKRLTKPS